MATTVNYMGYASLQAKIRVLVPSKTYVGIRHKPIVLYNLLRHAFSKGFSDTADVLMLIAVTKIEIMLGSKCEYLKGRCRFKKL